MSKTSISVDKMNEDKQKDAVGKTMELLVLSGWKEENVRSALDLLYQKGHIDGSKDVLDKLRPEPMRKGSASR